MVYFVNKTNDNINNIIFKHFKVQPFKIILRHTQFRGKILSLIFFVIPRILILSIIRSFTASGYSISHHPISFSVVDRYYILSICIGFRFRLFEKTKYPIVNCYLVFSY